LLAARSVVAAIGDVQSGPFAPELFEQTPGCT